MSRPLSRSLLSLLMFWQLLASVIAHPLDMAMRDAAVSESMAMPAMAEHCVHASDQHPAMEQTDQSSQGHVGCGSNCDCPCAGTAALSVSAPQVSPLIPESLAIHSSQIAPRALVLANLLRPPIS